MNAASDGIFFVENGLSQNQSMHDGKNSVFPVIVSFHLRAVWKKLTDAGVFFARNRWLMGAHHGVQATIQKHIEQGFVRWNRCDASRYFLGQWQPFLASRPLRAAGEPLDIAGFHAKVFFKKTSNPNSRRHVVFRKADLFPRQLRAADDVAVGPYEERGVTKTSRREDRQRYVFAPAFASQHRVTGHRHLRYVVGGGFDHLAEKFIGRGHVGPRQLEVVGGVRPVHEFAEIRVIDGGHV